MSVSKIVDKDYNVIFNKDRAIVQDLKGDVKMIAERHGDLFYVRESCQEANAVTDTKPSKVELWHRRFGHINFQALHDMKRKASVEGMDFSIVNTPPDCKTCIAAKLPRLPFLKIAIIRKTGGHSYRPMRANEDHLEWRSQIFHDDDRRLQSLGRRRLPERQGRGSEQAHSIHRKDRAINRYKGEASSIRQR